MADPDYFTLAEFRTLPDMSSARFPDDRVLATAAFITAILEREVGTSFVERTVTSTHDGGSSALVLSPFARSVTSMTVGGSTFDTSAVLLRSGVLSMAYQRTWAPGWQNISVTYKTGYSATPPADVKEAVMQGTRAYLLESSSDARIMDRTSSVTNDMGGTTSFVLAGPDRPTGYPQVDAVIIGWRDRLSMYGFA